MDMKEIEQKLEEHKDRIEEQEGKVCSVETAFKSILTELKESNKHYGAMCQMTDTYHRSLEAHAKNDNDWRKEIKDFMEKIYSTVWGNGMPGIKTQVFVLWLIGAGVIATLIFILKRMFT